MSHNAYLLAALIVFSVMFIIYQNSDDVTKSVVLGVFGSIIASVIFAVLNRFTENQIEKKIDNLAESVEKCSDIGQSMQDIQNKGIVRVFEKYGEKDSTWFHIIGEATRNLDLMGNSLSGWATEAHRKRFGDQIRRIVQDGGMVRILVMNPQSSIAQQKREIFGKKYESATSDFIEICKEVYNSIESEHSKNCLQLKLADNHFLTHMMIRTDHNIYVSHYMTARKATRPIVIGIALESTFSGAYIEDFMEIWRAYEAIDLSSWNRIRPSSPFVDCGETREPSILSMSHQG